SRAQNLQPAKHPPTCSDCVTSKPITRCGGNRPQPSAWLRKLCLRVEGGQILSNIFIQDTAPSRTHIVRKMPSPFHWPAPVCASPSPIKPPSLLGLSTLVLRQNPIGPYFARLFSVYNFTRISINFEATDTEK